MTRKSITCVLLTVLVSLAGTYSAWSAPTEVRIGVLAFRGKTECLKRWTPTAKYLASQITDHDFRIVPLTLDEMRRAVTSGSVEFVLTNPGNYVELEASSGISRVATLRTPGDFSAGNVFGAVMFVRADRIDIHTPADLVGKRFMAVRPNAFGGYQMAWRELKKLDIDPNGDFSELRFSGFPQDQVAFAVLNGKVDAGTLRTGVLEALAAEGRISLSKFRILAPQDHDGFPYSASTRLYPEWPFAKAKHTQPELAQRVVVALLRMTKNSTAAQVGRVSGWTVPLDYQPVHELMRELKIGPYEGLGKITLSNVVQQYRPWLLFALAVVLLTLTWTGWVEYLVKKRTRQLSVANNELAREITERKRAESLARERQADLARIARINTLGEMASGLAHELNHPLATITNYTNGCIRRLKDGRSDGDDLLAAMERVSAQAERAADVVRCMRNFVRTGDAQRRSVDLNELIRDVAALLHHDIDRHSVALRLHLSEPLPKVEAEVVQLEQVILNLAKNGLESMEADACTSKTLEIHTTTNGGRSIEVAVKDTGPGLDEATKERIFDPFVSTKSDGIGLGLSISRSILEAHGGRLWLAASDQNGSEFRFVLPIAS